MESHWIRALIGMDVREARKTAYKKGLQGGIMEVKIVPINGTKSTAWTEDRMPRTVNIQYNTQNNKVLDARIG